MTQSEWEAIANSKLFHKLVSEKKRFLIPAVVFFVVYYFALPISVGYFKEIMNRVAFGSINYAYLFALSQFFVAWILAGVYVRKADTVFDKLSEDLHREHRAKELLGASAPQIAGKEVAI